jgi:thiosulfate/3-mercaptopyruvate sulfurtransferase
VLADLQRVRSALEAGDAVILDVRTPAEYLGLQATAARNGHVPGAVNVDWSNNLEASGDAVASLRSDDELRDLYAQAGVKADKNVIVYCQTGHRASETFLVLRKLGFERVATYGPGWQEWGNRSDVPVDEG